MQRWGEKDAEKNRKIKEIDRERYRELNKEDTDRGHKDEQN